MTDSSKPVTSHRMAARLPLEQLVSWFETDWQPEHLDALAREMAEWNEDARNAALSTLVGIDLQQQWQAGFKTGIESYLFQFPELGTAGTVRAELVYAEWNARVRAGDKPSLDDFARRFPHLAERMRQRFAEKAALRRSMRQTRMRVLSDTLNPVSAQSIEPSARVAAPGATPPSTPSLPAPALVEEELAPGELFGRYRITRMLGRGGMGTVYQAEDTQLERVVALKIPHRSSANDTEFVERFEREARVAARLSHPCICPVYDVGTINDRRYMTMAFIDGQTVSTLVGTHRLGDRQIVELVVKIAEAVAEAHRGGIIHRDLKPANIMLTSHGEPRVTDFGLARRMGANEHRLTQSGMIIGTPAYMPLEQLHGDQDQIGPHTDVYSLGVILYELLTGHLPFQVPEDAPVTALFAKILTCPPDPASLHRPDLDPRLHQVVMRAIEKQPPQRFPSMNEFATGLRDWLAVANQPVPRSHSDWRGSAVIRSALSRIAAVFHRTMTSAGQRTIHADTTDAGTAAKSKSAVRSDAAPVNEQVPAAFRVSSDPVIEFQPASEELLGALLTESNSGAGSVGQRLTRRRAKQRRHLIRLASTLCVGAILLSSLIFWFQTGESRVRIEVFADDVIVSFQNETITLAEGPHGPREIRVKSGPQTLHIKSGDVEFDTSSFTLKRGDQPTVTISRVDQNIVAKLGDVEIGRRRIPVSQSKAAGATPAEETSAPSSGGQQSQTVDILKLLRDQSAHPRNNWVLDADGLKSPAGSWPRLQVPYTPPADYEIDMLVTRRSGGMPNLALGLCVADRQCALQIDDRPGWYKGGAVPITGIDMFNGRVCGANQTTDELAVFTDDVEHHLICRVTGSTIVLECDGKRVWERSFGQVSNLAQRPEWSVPRGDQLYVGTYGAGWTIRQWLVRPIGTSLATANTTPSPSPSPSPSQKSGVSPALFDLIAPGIKLSGTKANEPNPVRPTGSVEPLTLEITARNGATFMGKLLFNSRRTYVVHGTVAGNSIEFSNDLIDSFDQEFKGTWNGWKFNLTFMGTGVNQESVQGSASLELEPQSWTSLFNGRDLNGWLRYGNPAAQWTVEDGTLVGRTPIPWAALYSSKLDYRNFHLRMETMLSEGPNTALCVRVRPDLPHFCYWLIVGGTYPEEKAKMAQVSPLAPPVVDRLQPGQWFVMEAIAVGPKIEVRVDGVTINQMDCSTDPVLEGGLGVQVRGNGTVRYRRIEVRELPG